MCWVRVESSRGRRRNETASVRRTPQYKLSWGKRAREFTSFSVRPELPAQLRQVVDEGHLALVGRARVRNHPAVDAAAVEGQLARQLVVPHSRAPEAEAARRERPVGRAHPPAHSAEAVILVRREEPALAVVPEVVADDATLAP